MIQWEIRKSSAHRFVRNFFIVLCIAAVWMTSIQLADAEEDSAQHGSADEIGQLILNAAEQAGRNYQTIALYEPDNAYALNYQQGAEQQYAYIAKHLNADEQASGWNVFFQNKTPVITFLFLTTSVPLIFSQEKKTGMNSLLRTSKKGRGPTRSAKIQLTVLLTLGTVLAMNLIPFIIIGVTQGYSSPVYSIQSFWDMLYVPYRLPIWGYALLWLTLRYLSALSYALLLAACSAITCSAVFSAVCGVVVYLLNTVFFWGFRGNLSHYLYAVNLLVVSDGYTAINRYQLVHIGEGYSYLAVILFTYLLLCGGWIALLQFCHITREVHLPRVRLQHIVPQPEKKSAEMRMKSLFYWEWQKLLFTGKRIYMLLALIIVQGGFLYGQYTVGISDLDMYYERMMAELQGPYTETKYERIMSRRAELAAVLDREEEMIDMAAMGELTMQQYTDYQNDLVRAKNEMKKLQQVITRGTHLKELAERGIHGEFFSDLGVKEFIQSGYDPILFIGIILCISISFSMEYEEKTSGHAFARILRTTRHGRQPIFWNKIGVNVFFVLLLNVITTGMQVFFMQNHYDLTGFNAPLVSMIDYADVSQGITVGQYLLIVFLIRVLGSIVLAVIVSVFSLFLRDAFGCMLVTFVLTGLPGLLSLMHIHYFSFINFFHIFSGDMINLGCVWTAMRMLAVLFVCAFLIWSAERKYCGSNNKNA